MNDTYFRIILNHQYGWADVNDEVQSWSFEEGHYVLHLYKAEYSAWAYLPSEFTPTTIGFDAAVLPGFEQGGYGVICYYQDEDNYHAVTIDPYYREYTIGYAQNGDYQTLLEELWMPSQAMKDSPYDINQVLVICDPDVISLFVNDTLETQIPVSLWVEFRRLRTDLEESQLGSRCSSTIFTPSSQHNEFSVSLSWVSLHQPLKNS
jgi:hypothetical protein